MKIAVSCILHDDADKAFGLKDVVKFDDVGMLKAFEVLHLTLDASVMLLLVGLRLLDDLDGKEFVLALLPPGQTDLGVTSFPQTRLTDEIISQLVFELRLCVFSPRFSPLLPPLCAVLRSLTVHVEGTQRPRGHVASRSFLLVAVSERCDVMCCDVLRCWERLSLLLVRGVALRATWDDCWGVSLLCCGVCCVV